MIKTPEWLGEAGKKKWKQLVKRLPNPTADQADALALLCKSWETYLAAQASIDKEGQTVGNGGRLFVNPSVNVANEALKQIVKLSKALGLSPEAKGGTLAEPSPLAALIEGSGAG